MSSLPSLLLLKWVVTSFSSHLLWQHRWVIIVSGTGSRRRLGGAKSISILRTRILARHLLNHIFRLFLLEELTSRNNEVVQLENRYPRAPGDVQHADDVDVVRLDPVIVPP
jgi:hypothetical protein